MATDEITVEADEWEEDDAGDPTLTEEIIPYEGGIVPQAQFEIEKVTSAFAGIALKTHDGKPALYYDIRNKGVGLSARAMRVLSAMRGGFDEIDIRAEVGETPLPVSTGPDTWEIKTIPAVVVSARIKDLTTNLTRIGRGTTQLVGKRSDGSGWYVVPWDQALGKATALAKRNAYAEHFAAVTEALLEAVRRETTAGRGYFSGQVPAGMAGAQQAREAAMHPETTGLDVAKANVGAGREWALDFKRRAAAAGVDGDTLRAELAGTFSVAKWEDIPVRRVGEAEKWLASQGQAHNGAAKAAVARPEAVPATSAPERAEDPPEATGGDPGDVTDDAADLEAAVAAVVMRAHEKKIADKDILGLKANAGLTNALTEDGVKAFAAAVAEWKGK